jgi:glycosyltransferase involved in cell wall biosynthesis
MRIIARLNVGGPAHHVCLLTGRMDPERFDSVLVFGSLGSGEASFEPLAKRYGARLLRVPALRPEISPLQDACALIALVRLMRRLRPHIVETHTAKAGVIGRLAARLALGRRAIVLHTYHGHVLHGYFGPRTTRAFRVVESAMAHLSDALIAVSSATVDELVTMNVAPHDKFHTVALGLELEPFLDSEGKNRDVARERLGVNRDEVLALYVGRLVRVKRVDVLLRAIAEARARGVAVRLAVAGDGDERPRLEVLASSLGLDRAVDFLGFRTDLAELVEASDLAVLSSDNEGTPVAIIEAAAGGRPAVATAVGGVADIVTAETGRLVPPGDINAFATALCEMAHDPQTVARMGVRARAHVREAYAVDRLLRDMDRLYAGLLSRRSRSHA